MRLRSARAPLVGLAACALLRAHDTGPLHPDDLWSAWQFDPGVVVPILVAAVLYTRGARRSRGVAPRHAIFFWTGMAALALALVSPLHPLGEVLFSGHMAQHELLMLVAAPLLVLSRALVPFLWGIPFSWRRAAGSLSKAQVVQSAWHHLTEPLSAWWIHAAVLWIWHVPVLFQATLESDLVHTAQHLSFFVSALLFWWSLFYSRPGYGIAVLYVFTTAIHTGILGALLTFSPIVLYPAYSATAPLWGFTALEDQQIGGLIMWVPAGLIYTVAGLILFAAWLRESDAALERRRRYAE